MSEVQEMTGLTREDLKLLTTTISLIEVVEPGADPLLSFSEVYCLMKILERMISDGVIRQTRKTEYFNVSVMLGDEESKVLEFFAMFSVLEVGEASGGSARLKKGVQSQWCRSYLC